MSRVIPEPGPTDRDSSADGTAYFVATGGAEPKDFGLARWAPRMLSIYYNFTNGFVQLGYARTVERHFGTYPFAVCTLYFPVCYFRHFKSHARHVAYSSGRTAQPSAGQS